ncbi:diguanylate cyclase [Ramlibacter sp. H39-3-26]|uniref:GGDEF domain-containing protein n=1 Tax=Curvibacter soli TaxID=3031331 RepID=UPI0023DCD26A|nr:sensor domain-containing diguanylate cyclase [Ramlibacter sp. H39-3-26]MDF1485054.1 diguanylate cyclase [Ramlibacter sp. H39-3-26]
MHFLDRLRSAVLDLRGVALLGLLVLGACYLGIWARPTGFFSAFWLTNAMLLGLMVRNPAWAHWPGWLAAAIGYMLADLTTGGAFLTTLWLTASNMAGVLVGVVMYKRVEDKFWRMQRQLSPLYLFCVSISSALASALVGSGAGPVMFHADWYETFWVWVSTEFMNYVLLMPVIFTAPAPARMWRAVAAQRPCWQGWQGWVHMAPVFSVLLAVLAGTLIGGPGAIAFVVPALLWCALTYSLFTTCLLGMLVGYFQTFEIAAGMSTFTPTHMEMVLSVRAGVALLFLGPLATACSHAARSEMLRRLDHAVNFDHLTGAMARGAFMGTGAKLLARMAADAQSAAVLMLDIDHFKQVNDRHGHAAGDAVLQGFARMLAGELRPGDLCGRLGGEEFGVVLPRITRGDALAVAERLCLETRRCEIRGPDGQCLNISVSIGLVHQEPVAADTRLDALLCIADAALYEAKRTGRDRVAVVAGADGTAPLVSAA